MGCVGAYSVCTRRWGYYSGVPLSASDWSTLTPAERAAMTVWWGDTMIGCWCGPFPVIWPAVALLSTLPLLVAAIRQHAVPRWWSRFGLLSALCGCANVFVIAYGIGLAGQLNDGGWKWSVDSGTLAISWMLTSGVGICSGTVAPCSMMTRRTAAPVSWCTWLASALFVASPWRSRCSARLARNRLAASSSAAIQSWICSPRSSPLRAALSPA